MRARISIAGMLAVMLLASSSPLCAQRAEKLVLRAGGGYVLTSEGTLVDDGPAAGGLLGLNLLPHAWIMGGYSYLWLEGEDDSPRWETQGIFGMLGYDIVPNGMNGNWIFYVGAGAFRFDSEAAARAARTYFALNWGMKLMYDFSRHVAGSVEVGVAVAFADEAHVGGDVWLFPLGLGLAFRF